jgi:hypothetical protein
MHQPCAGLPMQPLRPTARGVQSWLLAERSLKGLIHQARGRDPAGPRGKRGQISLRDGSILESVVARLIGVTRNLKIAA